MSEEDLIRLQFQNILGELVGSKIQPTATAIISARQPMVQLVEELMYKLNKLQKENEELKEENEKINKVADKMYEYISYYGWEDFESNTGCNREEMVDYFYKE